MNTGEVKGKYLYNWTFLPTNNANDRATSTETGTRLIGCLIKDRHIPDYRGFHRGNDWKEGINKRNMPGTSKSMRPFVIF